MASTATVAKPFDDKSAIFLLGQAWDQGFDPGPAGYGRTWALHEWWINVEKKKKKILFLRVYGPRTEMPIQQAKLREN